jgi:ADP-ribosyl-[dinitrogen reductase] hydrolase
MKNIIIGMAIGDAVGVPYEFTSFEEMRINPCVDMVGNGTHNQPIGTWSDDTSMALCIVDSLCNGLNYTNMADKFVEWLYGNLWTPHGRVFDNGFATRNAVNKWKSGKFTPIECGATDVGSNGNGSVMRTLALVPYIENYNPDIRYTVVSNVSSITHAHWISKYSCYLVCEFAIGLRKGLDKEDAWVESIKALEAIRDNDISFEVLTYDEYELYFGIYTFDTILEHADDYNFRGSGFARDTAITSIWCILTTDTYKEAVLKAVNYGDDTDTTACVTGGLGGILYGLDGIPVDWVDKLVRKDDIIDLIERYEATYETI